MARRNPTASPDNLYNLWIEEDRSERRGLRASLAVAVAVHAVLLALSFPELSSQELEFEPPARPVFVVETPRFEPEKPDPAPTRRRPAQKVPVPDLTPYEPEPPVLEEPAAVLAGYDEMPLAIPSAPPEPEPVGPIRVGGRVSAPERLHYVEPRYTEIARKARVEGVVILQATIDERGDVTRIAVLKELSMGLTEAAVAAVEQWRFRPSTLGGKPVAVLYNLTVRFSLR